MKISISIVAAVMLSACSPKGPHLQPQAPPEGGEEISYAQVRPIFAQYCSACHPSRSQPNWLIYEQAKPLALSGRLLQRVFTERSMPPPDSAQAATITAADRQKIADWIQAGAPLTPIAQTTTSPPPGENFANAPSVASRCLQCHGQFEPSTINQPKIPMLAGQSEAYLREQLEQFKWRERIDPSVTMNDEAANLSKHEIYAISRYFSRRKGLPNRSHPPIHESTSVENGHWLAAQYCMSCHMNSNEKFSSNSPLVPLLAGQSKQYLINQLLYFRDRERVSPMMNEFAKNLTNLQINDLAEFFSASCDR